MKKSYNFPSFVTVETDIILDQRISDKEKLLYSVISVLCSNKENCCYATNRYFSELLQCEQRTIQNCLFSLKKYGYINIKVDFGYKRTIQPTIQKFIHERRELYDFDWLNVEEEK